MGGGEEDKERERKGGTQRGRRRMGQMGGGGVGEIEGVGKRVEGNGRGGGKMAVRRPTTQYSREEEV